MSPLAHRPQVGALVALRRHSGSTGGERRVGGGQKGFGVELLTLEVPCSLCKAIESQKWS